EGMEWDGDPKSVVLQHMNRLQNTNDVLVGDAATGAVQSIYRDHDTAWLDVVEDFRWLHGGKDFLWVSEQDGWRHVYVVARDGKARLVTTGGDVVRVVGVAPEEDWLYYIASPENATQRYLYRTRLDGTGNGERLTPANEAGVHSYQVSPNFRYAFHSYSSSDEPQITELAQFPSQRVL